MAKFSTSRVLFLWLVAFAFAVTIVIISTVLSSSGRLTHGHHAGLSLFVYPNRSSGGDRDKSPAFRSGKKLRELYKSYYPAVKVTPSVMDITNTPQRPVAEDDNNNKTNFSNGTFLHPTAAQIHESSKGATVVPTPASSPKPSPELSARERSYVLSLDITQQISGALHGYTDLATLGALLNLSTVEPYVVDTYLVGVPHVQQRNIIKLSDLYDVDMLKSTLKMCSKNNNHEMSTFETFLERASREVIFVYVVTTLSNRFQVNGLIAHNQGQNVFEIGKRGNVTQEALERLNRWAVHVSPSNSSGFHVSRAFVIDARPKKALHLSEILDVLGSAIRWKVARLGSATVLLHSWVGVHREPDSTTFYYIPEFVYRPCRSIYKVNHSQSVVDAANTFALSMEDDHTKTRIGVHVRGERLLTVHKKKYKLCLRKVIDVIYGSYRNSSSYQVRLIHDLGEYGTKTCYQSDCNVLRKRFLFTVCQLGFPCVHFYPSQYPSVAPSPAFVAAVEQEYLSRMDVLVTVGSGGFQTSTIAKFMQHADRNRNHLYKICSNKSDDSKNLKKVF